MSGYRPGAPLAAAWESSSRNYEAKQRAALREEWIAHHHRLAVVHASLSETHLRKMRELDEEPTEGEAA